MEGDWIGIYKGLRLPLLGLVMIAIMVYIFWPRNKKEFEDPKYSMLDDDVTPNLSEKFRNEEEASDKEVSSSKSN